MGGRKDPAWKYCVEMTEGMDGKPYKYVICNFCVKQIKGGVIRMKNHLAANHKGVAPCAKVPIEVKNEIKDYLKKGEQLKMETQRNQEVMIDSGSYYQSQNPFLGGSSADSFSQRGVRGPMDRFVVDGDGDSDTLNSKMRCERDAINCTKLDVGRFFFKNDIPFNVANRPSFISMYCSIGNFDRSFKPPTPFELSTWILEEEEKTTQAIVDEVKKTWSQTGVSILSGGWTDMRGRQLINFLANNSHSTVFLKSVDASDAVKDPKMLCQLLDDVVTEVGEDLVIQVVTDNSANYKAAGKLLMEKRPRLWWTPCAAHCIDLVLEKIGDLTQHKTALIKSKKVSHFIYSHGWVLALMRKYTKKELVHPLATRFAMAYFTLESMSISRESLERMFTSPEWGRCSWAKTQKGKKVEDIILRDENFWGSLIYALKTTKPLLDELRMANLKKMPGMGFLYGTMDKAKEQIAENLGGEEGPYKEIWSIIDDKWAFQMHRHLHAAAYFLNPHYQYDQDFSTHPEIKLSLLTCLAKHFPDPQDQEKIDLQIDAFRLRKGLFGFPTAKSTCKKRSPVDWWFQYGDGTPELTSFAVRILSLTCSALACECNRSTFNQIHMKKWNYLSTMMHPMILDHRG
ncbi:hypothetical protein LguiA_012631 [Lonicera macranthoides]